MKILSAISLSASLLLGTSLAQATPGDVECLGLLNNEKVTVLIGYDNFNEGPSLVEVSLGKLKVISASTVDEKVFNIGSEDRPVFVNGISAIDEIDSVAKIYFTKLNRSQGFKDGILNFAVNDGVTGKNIKIKCAL